jgi:hypothetical protein
MSYRNNFPHQPAQVSGSFVPGSYLRSSESRPSDLTLAVEMTSSSKLICPHTKNALFLSVKFQREVRNESIDWTGLFNDNVSTADIYFMPISLQVMDLLFLYIL